MRAQEAINQKLKSFVRRLIYETSHLSKRNSFPMTGDKKNPKKMDKNHITRRFLGGSFTTRQCANCFVSVIQWHFYDYILCLYGLPFAVGDGQPTPNGLFQQPEKSFAPSMEGFKASLDCNTQQKVHRERQAASRV